MTADSNSALAPVGRADQTLAKKRRLLQIAREEFIRQGYRAVTMDAIAQAAGVSKRTLYLWHEDKAALFRACLNAGVERFPLPQFSDAAAPEADLRAFGTELLREFIRPSTVGMARLLMREAHEFAEFGPLIRRSRDDYLAEPLADYLERAGVARTDSGRAAMLLLSMILAPVHNALLIDDALPDEQECKLHVDLAVRTFLRGREEDSRAAAAA
jgi:TetR/AcrR family transcriptional regulator, mexJK operon transcriptional repressor